MCDQSLSNMRVKTGGGGSSQQADACAVWACPASLSSRDEGRGPSSRRTLAPALQSALD